MDTINTGQAMQQLQSKAPQNLTKVKGQDKTGGAETNVKPENTEKAGATQKMSARELSREKLNAGILEESARVSLKSGDNAQALLFRTAIDRINEILGEATGTTATSGKTPLDLASSQDNSADATAQRILDFSLGFFSAYAKQNPGKEGEALVNDFVSTVRGGFEKGFKEATDILEGLKVFSGAIKDDVMKTKDLVLKGYDNFIQAQLGQAKTEKTA